MPSYHGYRSLRHYLRRHTQAAGLSLHALSLTMGLARQYWEAAAAGRFRPSRAVLGALAARFETPPDVLLVLAGHEPPPADPWLAEVAEAAARVPASKRAAVLRYLRRQGKSNRRP